MEFELNGKRYSTQKLDTRAQFHLLRKLGAALPVIEPLVNPDNVDQDPTILVTMLMTQLDDAAADYVMNAALWAVSRYQDTGWVKVMRNGQNMFSDIELADLLSIVAKVITENLGSFFHTALTNLGRAETPEI